MPDHEVDDHEPEEPIFRYLYLVLTYAVAIVFDVMYCVTGTRSSTPKRQQIYRHLIKIIFAYVRKFMALPEGEEIAGSESTSRTPEGRRYAHVVHCIRRLHSAVIGVGRRHHPAYRKVACV